jgi:predicted nucleotidyltransferase
MTINIEKARAFQQRKADARRQRCARLHAKAVQDFEAILQMIIEKYHPARIYQWGSLLHPEQFREFSDIDIAVEGLEGGAEAFFALYGDAEKMTDFPLDLLEIEKIEPTFADLIKMKGRVVYERS